jgi:hypothetical protein
VTMLKGRVSNAGLSAQRSPQPDGRRAGQIVMLLDNHYGPDRRVHREIELLADAEVGTTILGWDRRARPADSQPTLPADARLVRVHVPAPPGGGLRTLRSLVRFAARVSLEHGRELAEADVLVVHDIYLLPLAVALQLRYRKPLIYDAHEDFARMEASRLPRGLLTVINAFESTLARRAALIVVPGEVRMPRWHAAGFRNLVVVPNTGPSAARHENGADPTPVWDLVYCGLLDATRRLDLLVELARRRPDLRIAVAGSGRAEHSVAAAAEELPNFDFLGWTPEPQRVLAQAHAIYYGLDPADSYSELACPNNLYQAVSARRPLIFFCGGEPAALNERHRIGLRIEATVEDLESAVQRVHSGSDSWEFAGAEYALQMSNAGGEYAHAVTGLIPESVPGRLGS